MKRFQKVALGLVAVAVLIQLVRPEKTNPPVTAEIVAPPGIKSVLERACYDCHSNQTTWPWYSNVAPVSWLVINHVNDGRKHLNFSDWESYESARKKHKLEECEEEVGSGEMPMAGYVLMHSSAKLSDAERQLIVDWAKSR